MADHPKFLPTVEEVWKQPVRGTLMFQLCSKLKKQKVVLKKLNKEEFLPDRVQRAKESMEAAQEFVQLNPMNGEG